MNPHLRLALVACTTALFPASASAQPPGGRGGPPPPPPPIQFQLLGPSSGGRIAAISGVPGDVRTWYLGAASGGVWKSVDEGQTFVPVFDRQTAQAIGALAVAPSDPNQVWAGTGEAWAIRDADVMGDGIYKSTDAGATWTNVGLVESGRIGRIIVHPTNPNVVYVCALGRATGPQQERGVYRTTDGGRTWQRALFVDENTGCSGLALDVKDPNTLFAGMWQVVMHTYAMYSGGPSSGIHVTRDGGVTWTKLTHPGLPKPPLGKIDVAVAPTDSRRVYALIQTDAQGSVWRSDDGGASWKVASWARPLIGRAGYYINIKVSSGDPNEVYVASSSFHRSMDGGLTWQTVPWGGDNHDVWVDPKNPDHLGMTNDAGARVTTDRGRTTLNISLPIAQMYHVSVDQQVPYWVYGNRQDNGTFRGPSTGPETPPTTGGRAAQSVYTGRGGGDAGGRGGGFGGGFGGGRGGGFTTWDHGIGGCESGFTLADPTDANIIWATCYGNTVTRYDYRVRRARSVSPWMHTLDSPPTQLKYRCHWTPPLAIDPFDHNTVYYGCQVVFKTSNAGQSWSVISPDLSTQDFSRIVSSGGIVEDNLGQFYGEVVFAIAPSKVQRGLIWAGTNDGKVWYTRDGGEKWNDVTKNITGLPTWGTIRKIEPSHFDAGTAYIAVDFHMMDDRAPFIYKTTDFGQTWKNVTGDLPAKHPLAYVVSVAENPNRRGMLFAGTGNAFYYSLDDGAHWKQFQDGLPAAPVTWIEVPKLFHDVVVSTYGRGIYVLRDITTLEQQDRVVADADVQFYAPRAGFREARSGRVDFTYGLKAAPKDTVKLEIVDAKGGAIRTLRSIGRPGRNVAAWDLRYDPPTRVELRTVAPDNPFIWDEPRFRDQKTRPIIHWGIGGPQNSGPLALPGKYTARLTVDGKTQAQPFEVLRDPEITTTEADLNASLAAQLRIHDAMNATAEMVNRIEVMRKAIEDRLKSDSARAEDRVALKEMDQKLLDVELMLLSRSDLHSDDKWYVEQYKVYLQLVWLSGEVGTGAGDVAGGAEFRPTDASMAWLTAIEKELAAAKASYKALMDRELALFNRLVGAKPAVLP